MYRIVCENCGEVFTANKSNAKTCSVSCRVALHYRKKFNEKVFNTKSLNYNINKDVQQQMNIYNRQGVEQKIILKKYDVEHLKLQNSKTAYIKDLSLTKIQHLNNHGWVFDYSFLPNKLIEQGISYHKIGFTELSEMNKLKMLKHYIPLNYFVCIAYTQKSERVLVIYLTDKGIADITKTEYFFNYLFTFRKNNSVLISVL